jgi:hypothetical protein
MGHFLSTLISIVLLLFFEVGVLLSRRSQYDASRYLPNGYLAP